MRDITVAAVATRSEIGRSDANLENIRRWAARAKKAGAEFVLFPELAVQGFWLDAALYTVAQTIPGPATDTLIRIAAEADINLAAGIIEDDRGRYYNTHVVVGRGGLIGSYRKTHINPYESPFFAEGNRHPVFDLGDVRVGISTCNDNLYPENATSLALNGAEVLLMPFAYGGGDHEKWLRGPDCAAYRTRGLDTGCYVVAVNNAGPVTSPGGRVCEYPGGAFVSDPNGELLAETTGDTPDEKMLVATLSAEKLHARRSVAHYTLRLRRPEIYGRVCELA